MSGFFRLNAIVKEEGFDLICVGLNFGFSNLLYGIVVRLCYVSNIPC